MKKQQSLPGTEPDEHAEIREAAEDLRGALAQQKENAKRDADRVSQAKSVLVQRMIADKVVCEQYRGADRLLRVDLKLPEPTVTITVIEDET